CACTTSGSPWGAGGSRARPGGRSRFGPANETGLARSEKIGSVRNVTPSMRTRNVEWAIHVMLGCSSIAVRSYGTRGAAPSRPTSDVQVFRAKKGRVTVGPGHGRPPPGFVKTSPFRGAPPCAGELLHAVTRAARNAARRDTGRHCAGPGKIG